MGVTTDPFVAADLAAMIPEIWTNIVEEQMFESAVFSNFFLNLSSYMTEGGECFYGSNSINAGSGNHNCWSSAG